MSRSLECVEGRPDCSASVITDQRLWSVSISVMHGSLWQTLSDEVLHLLHLQATKN